MVVVRYHISFLAYMCIFHIFFASCSVSVIVVIFGDLLRSGIAPLPFQFRDIFGITLVYIISQMSLVRKKGVMSDLRTHESRFLWNIGCSGLWLRYFCAHPGWCTLRRYRLLCYGFYGDCSCYLVACRCFAAYRSFVVHG